MTRTLQQQFNLAYTILLGFITAGAQETKVRDELKQLNDKMCSLFLHGQIMTLDEMPIFSTTEKGKPVRQETGVA